MMISIFSFWKARNIRGLSAIHSVAMFGRGRNWLRWLRAVGAELAASSWMLRLPHLFLQVFAHTRYGASCAGCHHEVCELPVALFPNFGSCTCIVRLPQSDKSGDEDGD